MKDVLFLAIQRIRARELSWIETRCSFVRRVFLFGLIVLSLSELPVSAETSWEKMPGPPGIKVNVIYKANNVIFAGTEHHSVFRSEDNGLTWVLSDKGLERARISDIIV